MKLPCVDQAEPQPEVPATHGEVELVLVEAGEADEEAIEQWLLSLLQSPATPDDR